MLVRNYLAQMAIDKAEEGNFAECEYLLSVLKTPYSEQSENAQYAKEPPSWGQAMEISSSSRVNVSNRAN